MVYVYVYSEERIMSDKKDFKVERLNSMSGDKAMRLSVNKLKNLSPKRKIAFTLAEVLITLGVIGVVAAITMPMLITNINERVNSERQANIVYKITQAMEQMRAHGKLTRYSTTEAFVDELQKYLKITKRCDADHIAECWPTDTVIKSDETEYNIADAKTGENLSLTTDTNNVGLILADGGSLILNWDPTFSGLDVGDKVIASSIVLPVGNNKSKVYEYTTSVTAPVAFITDVNGKRGPNSETINGKYKDIRSFGGARLATSQPACIGNYYNDYCVYFVGTAYPSVNCNNPSDENYSFCYLGGDINDSTDYWAGAKYKCSSMGMRLPEISEVRSIYPLISSNAETFFWTNSVAQRNIKSSGPIPTMATKYVGVYYNGSIEEFTNDNTQQHNLFCIN